MPSLHHPNCLIAFARRAAAALCAAWLALPLPLPVQAAGGPVACPDAASGGVDLTAPPFRARADGSADASAAFAQALADPKVRVVCLPPGEYRLDEPVALRAGQQVALLGLASDAAATRIVWKADAIAFASDPVAGPPARLRSFTARNLTFDGRGTGLRAFNLLAETPATADTAVLLENVTILDTRSLPVWIEGFARVRIAGSRIRGTMDPAILRSSQVEIVDNEFADTRDNCLSVSRGNTQVRIAGNRMRNCRGAGVFVGGIFYRKEGGRSFRIEAAADAPPGTACTVHTAAPDYFRHGMVGTQLTVRSGAAFAVVEITGWNPQDRRAAPCRLVSALPAVLADKATTSWADGPHFGGGDVVIEHNDIAGTFGHGILLTMGVQGAQVRHNTIRASGHWVDARGEPQRQSSFGIAVIGWYLGDGPGGSRWSQDIALQDNRIEGATTGGVRVGSATTGGARRLTIRGNTIALDDADAQLGVLVDEHAGMPSEGNVIAGNHIVFGPEVKAGTGLRIDAAAAQACTAVTRGDVEEMRGGQCALRVARKCVAARAPAALACARR